MQEEVEELLPRGATELTRQQIRYLLQVSPAHRPAHPHVFTAVGHQGETLFAFVLVLLFLFLLLQTRLTADKSMRLLLSTFSSLREELLHMSEDLRVGGFLSVQTRAGMNVLMVINVCSIWRLRRRAWRET